jgi:hypothetical protein
MLRSQPTGATDSSSPFGWVGRVAHRPTAVSYTHLTLPTN